ncbi:sensor histidine kinase [Magnetococcales bacterium HHB-1]
MMRLLKARWRRTLSLALIMAVVAVTVGSISLAVLYHTAFEQARLRLTETAQSRARLMESIARYNHRHFGQPHDHHATQDAFSATLEQIREAHDHFAGFGATGEFTLAQRQDDLIVFILRHRHSILDQPKPVPFHKDIDQSNPEQHFAEPMRRALSGQSGTVIGPDYRGVTVLAAHEPVAVLNLGVVAKLDMTEIRAPFIRAAKLLLVISIIVISIGILLFFRVSEPMVRRIMENKTLREHKQQLLQAKEGLARAQEIAHLGNWDWNITTNTLTWSDEIYRIFGVEAQAFAATYEAFLEHVHPQDRQSVKQAVQNSLEDVFHVYNLEHRIVRPDGIERIVHEKGRVFRNRQREPIRMVGTVQDITERKQAEKKIRDLNTNLEKRVRERTHQLEAVNKELESYSYSVAHDLRAPLNNMIGFIKILLDDHNTQLDKEGQAHLRWLQSSATQMKKRINDYLNLARSSRISLTITEVNLSQLMMQAAISFKEAHTKTESIIVEVTPDILVKGDKDLLRAVAENLISNAIKFTVRREDQNGMVTFGVNQDVQGKKVYYVRDNGVGFDDRYIDRLFEPFERLHDQDLFNGSGIGLTTVERIIKRHGGSVWAESVLGEGASFYFTLGT